MNIWESVLVALEGIGANKMRAVLTMLGVIIGVGAVITMLALGRGAREQTMQRIQQMGTNTLVVFSGRGMGPGRAVGGMGSSQILTLADSYAIANECSTVKAVAPEVSSNSQVKYLNQNVNTSILGTSPEYLDIRNFQIAEGRMFTAEDVSALRKVAVIGPTTAGYLFSGTSPIGEMVRVQGIQFEIIGLLKSKGASGGFMDPDDQLMIPVTTAMRRVIGTNNVRSINVQAFSMGQMQQASREVDALLRARHRLAADDESSFMIRNQADIMEMAEETSQVFTVLLAGIAMVSLLVGGIGIMNIMLVSVTERTREIGIRMALGARQRDIQAQFLIEALVLSLFGGALGVLAGIAGSLVMGHFSQWVTAIEPSSIVLSFGFAALIGIFFGYYPARQASMMKPIDALRYE